MCLWFGNRSLFKNNFQSLHVIIEIQASQVALVVKNPPANAGDTDLSSTPGSGRPPGGGLGNPFLYSCLENPMDRGDWQATVHRVSKSQTWLKRQHAQHILLKSWNLSLRRDLVYLMFIQHLLNSSPTMVRYSIYHAICPSHIQYFNPLYSIPFQLGHPFE